MPKSQAALVADVDFIIGEIARQDALLRGEGQSIEPRDVFAELPHPNGGHVTIGRFADERVWELA
ncbi:MAG: hypothetical protein ACREE0_16910, partial [Phenylobacterium sp.]